MIVTKIGFVIFSLIFLISSLLYKFEYTEHARYTSLIGFGGLFIASIIITIVFTIQGIFHIWYLGANMGILLMFNAFTRVWTKEDVSKKLTNMMLFFIIFLMPFYTMQSLKDVLKEFIASHFHFYLNLLNVNANLVQQEPDLLTRLVFDNSAFLYVNWACVGFEFVSLYTAVILASDTSLKKKILGIAGSLVIIYIVNMFRLVGTGVIIARDLIGPLVTSENTIQMSYFLSESIFAQLVVIVAAVGLFITLQKYIPDVGRIISALLDLHPDIESWLKEKVSKYIN